jgi:hypothetical protein
MMFSRYMEPVSANRSISADGLGGLILPFRAQVLKVCHE